MCRSLGLRIIGELVPLGAVDGAVALVLGDTLCGEAQAALARAFGSKAKTVEVESE